MRFLEDISNAKKNNISSDPNKSFVKLTVPDIPIYSRSFVTSNKTLYQGSKHSVVPVGSKQCLCHTQKAISKLNNFKLYVFGLYKRILEVIRRQWTVFRPNKQ